ncbi:MAG: cell envelope integrity protein CreD [Alphaproteobacteria bacterium]|jgi:inner membrane protein|nr:cell envelope integrity protein CreD [Alphaproteobacteria bacterium]
MAHINFRGSETLNIVPIAKKNQMDLKANWGSPSFIGHFLPTKREISDTSFHANWEILSLATSLPEYLDHKDLESSSHGDNWKYKILSKAVGIQFLDVVDHYKQAERTTKYSFLFVLYTFLLFFLFEVIKKTKIHIFQYCITACSFLCFSLLLTAFAEHISFNVSYWVAAALIVSQITFYFSDLIKKQQERMIFSSFLLILYTYLFIVMRLEEFALLVGSIGMFAMISVAMLLTKKIDWFAEE